MTLVSGRFLYGQKKKNTKIINFNSMYKHANEFRGRQSKWNSRKKVWKKLVQKLNIFATAKIENNFPYRSNSANLHDDDDVAFLPEEQENQFPASSRVRLFCASFPCDAALKVQQTLFFGVKIIKLFIFHPRWFRRRRREHKKWLFNRINVYLYTLNAAAARVEPWNI